MVSLDAGRSWFRYHRLFADLLQLELRRTEPHERAALHRAAAAWLAEHGHPVEAVRQAQAAEDWGMAARLLSDHWLDLFLSGQRATLVELLARFPCRGRRQPELTAVRVAGDLTGGSLQDAGRHLTVATGALASVPADRRGRLQVLLSVLRLFLARRLNDFPVVVGATNSRVLFGRSTRLSRFGSRPSSTNCTPRSPPSASRTPAAWRTCSANAWPTCANPTLCHYL